MRALRVLGVVLVLAGVVAFASPTVGLTFAELDREVSVGVSDDSTAYVGVTDRSSGATIDGPDDTATVFDVTDNGARFAAAELAVTVDSVERRDGSVDDNPTVAARIGGSGPFDVVLSCAGSPPLDGDYKVTLELDVTGELTVEATRTTDEYVSVSCDDTVVVDGESGPIDTEGDVDLALGAEVDGDVDSGGTVTTGDRAEIGGSVDSSGPVDTGTDTEIDGSVDSGGGLSTGDRTEIGGDVSAGGSVDLGAESEVGGSLDSDGSLTTGPRSSVDGDVTTGGAVTLGSGTEVDGSINSGGSVTLRDRVAVGDDVTASGDVTLGSGSEVDGDVAAGGTVYLGCNVEVDGSIDADRVEETC